MQSTIPPPRNRVSRASAGSADSCPASSLRSGRGAARRVAQVVKGLSAEPLSRPQLEADKPFPNDRVFALAQPSASIDTINPQCKEWPVRDADAGRGSGQGDNRTRSQRYPAHRASQGAESGSAPIAKVGGWPGRNFAGTCDRGRIDESLSLSGHG